MVNVFFIVCETNSRNQSKMKIYGFHTQVDRVIFMKMNSNIKDFNFFWTFALNPLVTTLAKLQHIEKRELEYLFKKLCKSAVVNKKSYLQKHGKQEDLFNSEILFKLA